MHLSFMVYVMVLSVLQVTYTRMTPISELVLKLWSRNLRRYVVSNTRNYIPEELAVSFYRVEYLSPLMSMSHPRLTVTVRDQI